MLILKDSKQSWEEEEREKLIIMLVEDWLFKIKINIILQNIDLLPELHVAKWYVK